MWNLYEAVNHLFYFFNTSHSGRPGELFLITKCSSHMQNLSSIIYAFYLCHTCWVWFCWLDALLLWMRWADHNETCQAGEKGSSETSLDEILPRRDLQSWMRLRVKEKAERPAGRDGLTSWTPALRSADVHIPLGPTKPSVLWMSMLSRGRSTQSKRVDVCFHGTQSGVVFSDVSAAGGMCGM